MEDPHSESLEASLAELEHLDEVHVELGKQMFKASAGSMYGMDLFAVGALNRSRAHITGFRQLLEAKNLICAGALLRLQLDTALRFHAAFLVEEPHEFALAVLNGQKVRDLKDRDGKRMTDSYLVNKLGHAYDWVPRVYERTSGYIHLSATHLMSAMWPMEGADESNRSIMIEISAEDKHLPPWIYIETVDAFRAATEILLHYVSAWVCAKENPERVGMRRKDCDTYDDA